MGPPPHVHPTAGDAQHPQSFTFLGRFRAFEVAVTAGHVLPGVWSLGLATPPPNPCFKVFCMSTAPTGRLTSTLVLGTRRHSCSR